MKMRVQVYNFPLSLEEHSYYYINEKNSFLVAVFAWQLCLISSNIQVPKSVVHA